MTPPFALRPEGFFLHGQPFRLLSGAIHYFRVHPAQWADRLAKARAMGLNAVETYVAWNLHEPRPGEFHFAGQADLVAFLREAERQGLYVLVRPGPYICAEWEFGGLPAWLLREGDMRLRTSHPAFLRAARQFFGALLPRLAPLQITRGGPLLMMQVENEYGSYGSDQAYLRALAGLLRQDGIDVPLFTSDGPSDPMLTHGTLPGVLGTVNFGSDAPGSFGVLARHQAQGPQVCLEFWNGWFDHWTEAHHVRAAADAAKTLDDILRLGGHVNLYMLHGGTNFGFMAGANTAPDGTYQPTVSSYDYDAPISEAGDLTPKYHALREVIGRYEQLPPLPEFPVRRASIGGVRAAGQTPLWDALPEHGLTAPQPLGMEEIGQAYGYLLYRGRFRHVPGEATLHFPAVHDRALVFLNGERVGTVERDGPKTLPVTLTGPEFELEILVENLGRVNYGPELHDRKGLLGAVRLGYTHLHGWEHFPLPLAPLPELDWQEDVAGGPAFHRFGFEVTAPGDTFLALPCWHKGTAWVNGFHLGRYWEVGPTRTLYIPEPVLRGGRNELVVLEEETVGDVPEFRSAPDLGQVQETARGG